MNRLLIKLIRLIIFIKNKIQIFIKARLVRPLLYNLGK